MEDLVETVVARYRGEARLQRLRWIILQADAVGDAATAPTGGSAMPPPPEGLRASAVQAMVQSSQQDGNLHRYRELFEILATHAQQQEESVVKYDNGWVQEKEASLRQDRAVLKHRLASVQSHLHKEAIRAAYLAVAEHDWRVGDIVDAFHSVSRAKDYCTTRQQTTAVCLMMVVLAILMNNHSLAKEWLLRLDHTVGNDMSPVVQQQIQTASGLERLMGGDYAKAAMSFAQVCKEGGLEPSVSPTTPSATPGSPGSPNAAGSTSASNGTGGAAGGSGQPTPPAVLASEDISLYAAILAMGCASGPDMVALAEHPEALELVPRLKEALVLFGRRSDYSGAWAILDEYVQTLKYDLYMAPHLPTLQIMIREKAVASYWKAYERVELQTMAEELGPGLVPSVDGLRTLLVKLIRKGTLEGSRIDLGTQTLHRDPPPKTNPVRAQLDKLTRTTLDDTYSILTRMACLEHDLVVSSDNNAGAGSRGRRGASGRNRSTGGPTLDEDMDEEDDPDMMEVGDGMNPEDFY